MKRYELGDYIKNIKSSNCKFYRLNWNRNTKKAYVSMRFFGPYYEFDAKTQEDAIKFGHDMLEKIETGDEEILSKAKRLKIITLKLF